MSRVSGSGDLRTISGTRLSLPMARDRAARTVNLHNSVLCRRAVHEHVIATAVYVSVRGQHSGKHFTTSDEPFLKGGIVLASCSNQPLRQSWLIEGSILPWRSLGHNGTGIKELVKEEGRKLRMNSASGSYCAPSIVQ